MMDLTKEEFNAFVDDFELLVRVLTIEKTQGNNLKNDEKLNLDYYNYTQEILSHQNYTQIEEDYQNSVLIKKLMEDEHRNHSHLNKAFETYLGLSNNQRKEVFQCLMKKFEFYDYMDTASKYMKWIRYTVFSIMVLELLNLFNFIHIEDKYLNLWSVINLLCLGFAIFIYFYTKYKIKKIK